MPDIYKKIVNLLKKIEKLIKSLILAIMLKPILVINLRGD